MGWGFRRSLKLGPLKLHFSKSGVGYSVGVRGFRVGKDAKGRSYTAASIPGTGLYSRTYSGKARAGGAGVGSPAAPAGRSGGIALALGMLALAFMAGGLVVFLVMPRPVPPPLTPPAAVSAPQAPAQPIPTKQRRVHRSKQSATPVIRQSSATTGTNLPQTVPDGQSPAN